MKRVLIGVTAALGLAAAAYAQDRGPGGAFSGGPFQDGPGMHGMRGPLSSEDRAAFTDARIAALHAGLKLNADQEKLWPPVEEAIRGLVKQRRDARMARRERFAGMNAGMGDDGRQDMPGTLRFMADWQAASADALRKLADASTPLYTSLDEGQKRRLAILARFTRPDGGMERRGPGGGYGPGRDGMMRRGDLVPKPADRTPG